MSNYRWDHGQLEKLYARLHNIHRRFTISLSDDDGTYQTHQVQGFPGEVRNHFIRPQEYGRSTMPLPGAEATTLSVNAGYHGAAIITNTGDPRPNYRPVKQKPGEIADYIVDGADKEGNNGTLRMILKGALMWITTLYGKTINIADNNATTINVGDVTPDNPLTINVGKAGQSKAITLNVAGKTITIGADNTLNITAPNGDVVVNGVSLVNHVHSNSGGTGDSGPPVH
jgi:phage gp45-like